ncbi:MAG: 50S ribosome-binding GTPase [Planctomycetes bacterium]|nr:50S ribosome-binding GTPase [Planctomycetota bacterium]
MLGDTIVAQASAPGAAERAVLRLSGPAAIAAAAAVFAPPLPRQRAQVEGALRLGRWTLPALALVFVAPASFTGEDTVELHVPGSPMLVRHLLDALLAAGRALGVRQALPGEFTARACQNGRLDLAQAEGVLLLLQAADGAAAAAAVQWLHGGYSEVAASVRARLQDALALLEAGLDFAEEESAVAGAADWLAPLPGVTADLQRLLASLPAATPGGEVLLLGRANAGKSSLANALAGEPVALVDARPGTTRDLLRVELEPGVVLWDAPGDLDQPAAADAAALALRDRLGGGAAAMLCVLDATWPVAPAAAFASPLPCLGIVWTKCDAVAAPPEVPAALAAALAARTGQPPPVLATSARTGQGLESLRRLLARAATGAVVEAGGPLRAALVEAQAAVERARVAAGAGPELAATELRAALGALDGVGGTHSPEQLLDRIYRRFCLGK